MRSLLASRRSFLHILAALSLLFGAFAMTPPALAAEKAPDFTLKDMNGKTVSLSDFRGKVVLVTFWATWCTPCKAEMPHFQRMYKAHKGDGLVILGISIDDAKMASKIKPTVKMKKLTYPILLDPETEVVSMFNPSKNVPFSVLINRVGEIERTHAGYKPGDEVELEKEIKALLAK